MIKYEASEFVDTLDIGKHVVFFYEKLEYGLMIEFRFINNGLLKGEQCIYATQGDTKFFEDQMSYSGINVEDYKRKNLLHIYQIPNAMDDPGGALKGAERIMNKILADSKHPFRVISIFIPEINTNAEMVAALDIERSRHTSFSNLHCSWLCPYYVENIEVSIRDEFMDSILRNHHAVISASRSGLGIAFNIE